MSIRVGTRVGRNGFVSGGVLWFAFFVFMVLPFVLLCRAMMAGCVIIARLIAQWREDKRRTEMRQVAAQHVIRLRVK